MTTLLALIAMAGPAFQDQQDVVVGKLKYDVVETSTGKALTSADRQIKLSDVKVTEVNESVNKVISLGEHFTLAFPDPRNKSPFINGFGLVAGRDDQTTFSWEWFEVSSMDKGVKAQEKGEVAIKIAKVGKYFEVVLTDFKTDVSFRLNGPDDQRGARPRWRVNVKKGSVINWPSLVDGKVVPNGKLSG